MEKCRPSATHTICEPFAISDMRAAVRRTMPNGERKTKIEIITIETPFNASNRTYNRTIYKMKTGRAEKIQDETNLPRTFFFDTESYEKYC